MRNNSTKLLEEAYGQVQEADRLDNRDLKLRTHQNYSVSSDVLLFLKRLVQMSPDEIKNLDSQYLSNAVIPTDILAKLNDNQLLALRDAARGTKY